MINQDSAGGSMSSIVEGVELYLNAIPDDLRGSRAALPVMLLEQCLSHIRELESVRLAQSQTERELAESNVALIKKVQELEESLQHMKWCSSCAEGPWEDCEGGQRALELLPKSPAEAQEPEGGFDESR